MPRDNGRDMARENGPSFRCLRGGETVTIRLDGEPMTVPAGVSVAAALLVGRRASGRRSAVSGAQRGAYCLIGQCFECTMTIDGVAFRQACLTPVRDGMTVERQVA